MTDRKPVYYGWGRTALDGVRALEVSGYAGESALTSAEVIERISPATGVLLAEITATSTAGVDEAVQVAAASMTGWSALSGAERAKVLSGAAELIDADRDELARLITLETGKPISEAQGEVTTAANIFRYYAGAARDVTGEATTTIANDLLVVTLMEPAGVAAILVPWNFPVAILAQKLPAALAAGCGVVVKPSPLTPASVYFVLRGLEHAGMPRGVVTVVQGGPEVGSALVEHPDVAGVSFTGSTATAKAISAAAGKNTLKRLVLEAGGKTPVIITDSADIAGAVTDVLRAGFVNQGSTCVAGSRILVSRGIAAEFTDRLVHAVGALAPGAPLDASTRLGAIVTPQHRDNILATVAASIDGGATLAAGGAEVHLPAGGPYLAPTILTGVPDDNPAATTEIFGPVVAVQEYGDLAEAIERANDSEYGLGACVWSENLDHAIFASRGLSTGTVWVNGSLNSYPEIPLGGRRNSGVGSELGRAGMEFFLARKAVHLHWNHNTHTGKGIHD